METPNRIACVITVSTPYFQARFASAMAAMMPTEIHAIEIGKYSGVYEFTPNEERTSYQRHILDDKSLEQQRPNETISKLTKSLNQIRPDVVLVPGWSGRAAFATLVWCVHNQVPAVAMSESTAWDEKRRAWSEAVKKQVVGLFSAGLAGGTPHKDYLVQLGMPMERVFLGYDAVDNEYFSAKAEQIRKQKTESRKQSAEVGSRKSDDGCPPSALRPPPSAPYFLASARFIEKKNLPRLIHAYALYRKKAETLKLGSTSSGLQPPSPQSGEGKSESGKQKAEALKADGTSPRPSPQGGEGGVIWDLVLLGDGELRSSLQSQVSSLGLQHCVLLPGFIQYPELPKYYAHAGAFIHASTTEPWGLVVNEAMASGLPVLVSRRCGCAQDLVQDGVNGFTFDPYNVEQLAKLMLRISDFRFPISDFGNASSRIVSAWGPERFASGLQAAVEKALAVGPVQPTFAQRMILNALLVR